VEQSSVQLKVKPFITIIRNTSVVHAQVNYRIVFPSFVYDIITLIPYGILSGSQFDKGYFYCLFVHICAADVDTAIK